MRSFVSLLFLASTVWAQPVMLLIDEPGAWSSIFGAIGMSVRQVTEISPTTAREQVQAGAIGILEGASTTAEIFGIVPSAKRVPTRSVIDSRAPKLGIVWEHAQELPVYELPADARIFVREKWTGAPLMAGLHRGKGAVLWLATKPGIKGYERYPYILNALTDLGLQPPLRSNRLWAFFDSSYRSRVDVDYFAERWREAGLAALHVAAWHYNEPDQERDEYLRALIAACHKRAILVYAWLELPHVSEKFWQDHPAWREKTGLLQDAHLDWRKLMNLNDPDCQKAVAASTKQLLGRFDWDGVNLAELYFESLEGAANAARFTPMNDSIRREYESWAGVDPYDLLHTKADPAELDRFLDWRAALAKRMQIQWLGELQTVRRSRPDFDIVLTHVDDRFDTRMRQLVGADAAAILPLLGEHDFQFLIEDPATLWHLGPERYAEIAKRYAELTPKRDKLAIDINIVERYQDVYPTKQQTGVELLQLVQTSSRAFDRVALYFENSISRIDWPLLPASGAVVKRFERSGDRIIIESAHPVGVQWTGPAKVNGNPWPISDGRTIWLPAGSYVLDSGSAQTPLITDFNGDLKAAHVSAKGLDLSYRSSSRALAMVKGKVRRLEVDGVPVKPVFVEANVLALPRGQHLVTIDIDAGS